jgi:hypothetical protein
LAALEAAGIEGHVQVGWLRHIGAYNHPRSEGDADRLGHTSKRLVDTVYLKLYDDLSRAVAAAIDEAITKGTP